MVNLGTCTFYLNIELILDDFQHDFCPRQSLYVDKIPIKQYYLKE